MLKTLTYSCLALTCIFSCGALSGQSTHSMFVPANMEWKDSPVTEGLQIAEDAEVFIFNSDHTYSYVSAVLHKDKQTRVISLCSGCGFSTQKGSWRISNNSQVRVRFHLAHTDIKTNEKRTWTVERWSLEKAVSPLHAEKLGTSKGFLVSFSTLNNPDVLAAMLRDDN